jgi:hypothetical protein
LRDASDSTVGNLAVVPSRFRKGGEDHKTAEAEAEDAHDRACEHNQALRRIYRRQEKRATLQQQVVGWAFFIVFLAYPSVTNKIFALFYCFDLDKDTSILMADYSLSCSVWIYKFHWVVCVIGVCVIPVGIPLFLGRLINRHKLQIMNDEGPHYLETLYKDYKKEACISSAIVHVPVWYCNCLAQ